MISNKRVLVTGGFGFIGWHVSRKLLDAGNHVTVLDLVQRGTCGRNLEGHNLTLLVGDIRDKNLVDNAVGTADIVFHMAALGGAEANLAQTIEIEVMGMNNILSAARRHNTEKLLYTSSSTVYGHTSQFPSRESNEVIPSSTYALTKLFNEERVLKASREWGLRASLVRYFNVYGPFQSQNAVIPRYIHNCLNGIDLTIYGPGTQTRDFTYIDDTAEATIGIAGSQETDGTVINIATGIETSISQLADLVIEVTGADVRKVICPFPEGRKGFEVERCVGDAALLQHLTGLKCETPLRDGLRLTAERMQNSDSST